MIYLYLQILFFILCLYFLAEYNAATADETISTSNSNSYKCKYGDLSFSVGQNITIGPQSDSSTYTTTCSCNTPPLVTCIKTRK